MVLFPKFCYTNNFQLYRYSFPHFVKFFQVGNFIRPLYVGTWKSNQTSQGNFVQSQSGDIILSLDYMPYNKEIEDKLIFSIEIFTKQYIEDQNMILYTELDLKDNTQTQLTGNYDKSVQKLIEKIFSLKGQKKCKMESVISLQDDKGNPLNIQTNDISNIIIKGGVQSKDCEVDFTFESHPIFLNLGGIFLFTIASIVFIILGFTPFYKAIQNEGDMTVMNLNGYFLLFNILVDICIMMINVTIAMRILPYYFEFLILITFFLMISILFKFRIYLFIYEQYFADLNLPEEQLQKQKFYLLLKTFFGIITIILIANIFIIHYYLFVILFLYPLFQIFYNCYYVVRKNCFIWNVHAFLVLPQVMYPFALRSNLFTFFKLKSDPKFVLIILSMTFFFLIVLMLQRYLGRNFFMPRICIPDYYNYFKKIKKDQTYADCPICMSDLTQKPDQEIEIQQPLLNKQFMQTPCGHQFHKECLQQWMDQKLHCPYCRTAIPPYQLMYKIKLIIAFSFFIFLYFIFAEIMIPKINNKQQFQSPSNYFIYQQIIKKF